VSERAAGAPGDIEARRRARVEGAAQRRRDGEAEEDEAGRVVEQALAGEQRQDQFARRDGMHGAPFFLRVEQAHTPSYTSGHRP
jgi:hypothetical protein